MLLQDPFLRFLDRSPTPFHAVREITNALAEADFTPLAEKEKWKIEPGLGYFLTRGDSMVAAFRAPQQQPTSAILLASHLDSPCLKIKPQPEMSDKGIGQFGTEVYGSPILHTWLDRDLCIAGRISVLDGNGRPVSHIVSLDEYPLIIPQLALHLDRGINERGPAIQKQDHLKPVFSLNSKDKHLVDLLRKHHAFKALLGFDLFLVPTQKGAFLGFDSELVASYKLDNLTSAYASLYALLNTAPQENILQGSFFWDHEEIGSMTHLGADSRFANEMLERICLCFQMNREDFLRFKSQSLCLSGDLAHGFNPNFPDKYDPQNSPLLGHGPVLKFNAQQKYATNSSTASAIAALAKSHKIPLQKFASRSDIPSGSTVGPFMASQLSIPTVDLGIAGWAMHSIREVISIVDERALCSLFQAVLTTPLALEDWL